VTPRHATAKVRVVTRAHGSRFLVGKHGPAWVILVGKGKVTGAPPVLDGGRGGDPGDDYPWKNVPQDSGLDPWGEYYRECTSFVAWALHSRNNFNMPFHDDAYNWGIDARNLDYPVNDTPAVGAVAWEPKLPGHAWGHVMWVSAVNGNQVTVEEYNEHGNGTYDQRTYTLGSEPYQYIHFRDISANPPTVPTPPPPTSPPSGTTYTETTGGVAATWTNYVNAGGTQGPSIGGNQSVQISCRIAGFRVADGNTWWYQIASTPWSNSYYVSADAFYNNGSTSGSLLGTPFVDPNVQVCGGGGAPNTWAETVGSVANTWTNYSNAGGVEGPQIANGQTVQITCRLTGFTVADGNTWWYRIASSPWNNGYYVSADAFYNNGATSGPLKGTPFVDTNVATC
jgi:surface antigen